MPMDYDDNDFQSQNLHLAGEGGSTVSPVLRSYPLPKFEFDDTLHGHIRFDSLVENEVFLGITSQEDNHWIEEYSRGSSGIEFSSSVAESRRNNVWSEATSSESVEMLLKSVGQEEKVTGETIDEPGHLATVMDPNLKQDDRILPNESPENFSSINPSTSQSQEAQISAGELDSIVLGKNCKISVPEEKVEIRVDENQEVKNLTNESSKNVAGDLPKISSSNEGENKNKSKETGMDYPKILGSRESNVSSPSKLSHVQSRSIEETENAIPRDHQLDIIKASVGNDPSETGEENVLSENVLVSSKTHSGESNNKDKSPTAEISGSVQVNDEIPSSEPDALIMDQDVTFNKKMDASLPSDCSDMDIKVIEAIDSRKNVESSSSAEGCKEIIVMAQGSEADMTILAEPNRAEPVAAVKSDTILSPASDGVHLLSRSFTTDDIVTNSPIFGATSMHHDNEKKMEKHVESMVDCSSEGPLSVFKKAASPDHAGQVAHETAGECAPPVVNINAITNEQAAEANPDGPGWSTASNPSPLPCDSSTKSGDKVEDGGLPDPKESTTEHHQAAPLSLTVSNSDEQHASIDAARPSEFDANHTEQDGDGSVLDKPQFVSHSETSSIELSQSAKDKHEVTPEKASIPKRIEIVEEKVQLVSSNNNMKADKSFTFEVNASAGLGQIDKGSQSIPAIQPCITNVQGSSINSSSSLLNPGKSHDVSISTPQTPSIATIQVGAKNTERKTRRKSSGKESAKKGTRQKETTPRQSGRVEKSSPLLTPPATGHVIQFEELKPKENIDSSITKSSSVFPVPTSNLPDLNNSSSIFQQPFTDNQQVQLRAQILVYGSLISGTPPEEPHMIAAFGQSDSGRKAWEATWRERVHGQKSQANDPDTPMHPRSDIGHRTPDLGIKHGPVTSVPSKVFSSPIGGSTIKGTPPVISPLIPLSSPLWNMSTPSSVGFPSSGIPRTVLHDYRQSLSPLHPYQTPVGQNFAGHNPPWLSPGPFGGPWVASSPVSGFNVGPRFSAEAVKLTPVKVSGGPGIKHTNSIPVVHSVGPTVFSGLSGQASGDSKSRKRKKVSQTLVPSQTPVASVPAPLVAHQPQVPHIEGHGQVPLLAQKPTDSITTPIVSSLFSTSVTVSTPVSSRVLSGSSTQDYPRISDKKIENVVVSETLSKDDDSKVQTPVKMFQPSSDLKSTKRKKVVTSLAVNQTPVPRQAPVVAYLPQILLVAQTQTDSVTTPAVYSASTHDNPRTGYQNIEKAVVVEETLSKVEESKLQAENAAMLAANEVSHCEGVWSWLEQQKGSGVVDDEAKLMSSAVSVAAAASVAKVAAAAAKIASNVAEQARLMADEVLLSSRTENNVRSGMISHPNSIISAAREAARRRIEAASAASKHAENLDAIVKAAELAAEAVSQSGKIAAMGDPSAFRKLVEAGPQGYWKTFDQPGEISGHLNSNSGKKNLEAAPNVSVKEIQTLKYGLSPQGHSGSLAENQMMVIDGISGSRAHKDPDLSKTIGFPPETETGSICNYLVGQNVAQSISRAWEEHNIKEGCLVEVYKDDGKYKGAWFAANVLSVKDEKVLVCYTEIQSDEGPEKLKEWVALDVEGAKVPRIRIAHPMTTMRFEGSRKRRRTAVTDYAWSNGDRVDVWLQDRWCEGVVMEPNKIDITSLTVQFPAQGESSVVRSWHVRPTLIWKDRKWIDWTSLKGGRSTELQGDTPKEKRTKPNSPTVKDKPKDKSPKNIDILESGRLEESRKLPLSAQESSFNVGKNTKNENKINTHRLIRGGLQKDGSRVIIGVPKPGKKQKFMEVSKHYVGDGSDKNNTANDSIKFTRYLKPQAPQGWKINSRNNVAEKQVAETKTRVRSRKPPVPSFRTLAQKDNNSVSSKSTTRDAEMADKSDRDSVSDVENVSSHQNQMEFGSSSNTEDAQKGPALVDAPKRTFGFTSNTKSERLNKGKLALAGGKTAKVEAKSIPEVTEPRRSNRRIQPTSRLLEGLQSSLTISKIPSVSHGSQRSHNKVTSKGNTNHG